MMYSDLKKFFIIVICLLQVSFLQAQKERMVHYIPAGNDFVCVKPTMRFNRALYGTHTAFRVEAGDLPEFAMYMPGMGGNLRFALVIADKKKMADRVTKNKNDLQGWQYAL